MEPLLAIRDLHTEFRTGAGVVRAVDGVSLQRRSGRDRGRRRRKRLRQVGHRAVDPAADPDPPGRIAAGAVLFGGRDLMTLSRSRDARDPRRRNRHGVPGADDLAEPGADHRPADRRDAGAASRHGSRARRSSAPSSCWSWSASPTPARRLQQYPHQLSGGMRQRVMIAIALACEPKLIIADEPTTALDVTIQAQILELMKALTRRLGMALMIITHNLGVVARYADRVNVMYAGRIVESGPAAEIYHRPRHPYTLALLRSVPRLDRPRQARLDPVEGQPPDLTRLDAGCAFRPRCRFGRSTALRRRSPPSARRRARRGWPARGLLPHAVTVSEAGRRHDGAGDTHCVRCSRCAACACISRSPRASSRAATSAR